MKRSKYEIIHDLMQESQMTGIDTQEIGRNKLVIRDNDDEYVSPSVYRV